MRRTSNPEYVQTVRGKPYCANYAVRSLWWLLPIPIVIALASGDLFHMFGVPLVVIGSMYANARFSPVQGCLAWVPIIGLAIYSFSSPSVGIPLFLYCGVAWFAGSIECRLTLDPYEANDENQACG